MGNISEIVLSLSVYLPTEQSQKKDRSGLSSGVEAPDKISHRKYVVGVHERLLCATVEFSENSQPQGTKTSGS